MFLGENFYVELPLCGLLVASHSVRTTKQEQSVAWMQAWGPGLQGCEAMRTGRWLGNPHAFCSESQQTRLMLSRAGLCFSVYLGLWVNGI